jgi:two-component system alkaline phosphatase synthesis response regulator PhoP
MPAKILIVDDEAGIRNLISAYLRKEGYEIYEAVDGPGAVKSAHAFKPDIIILDIMLPGMDGLEALNQIRRESETYVILLTAKTEETDKIVGLSVGADDYVTKPFSPRELVARVKAVLRRISAGNIASPVLITRHLRLDSGSRMAWLNDTLLDLTLIEFNLLEVLMKHHGQAMTREQLLENVWGQDYFGETRVVDVHIGHVRQKLDGRFISAVRGIGYRLVDRME